MKVFRPLSRASTSAVALALALAFVSGCGRGRGRTHEVMYVTAPQAFLRDRVAAVYSKTATLKNGDVVDVLDREKRFAKVRTAAGAEGWIEQRYLISQQVFDRFQDLTKQHQNDPIQATGTTRNDTNLHLEPGRETDHLYQLAAGSKLTLLARGTAERTGVVAPPNTGRKKDSQPAGPVLEDWWLSRDAQGHAGWVLARMVDLDVPLEIAQYAEGQRFTAFFVLNEVQDCLLYTSPSPRDS